MVPPLSKRGLLFKPGSVGGEYANPVKKSMLSFHAEMTNSHSPPKEGKVNQIETKPWHMGINVFPGTTS